MLSKIVAAGTFEPLSDHSRKADYFHGLVNHPFFFFILITVTVSMA
jgi:hypothetical protein